MITVGVAEKRLNMAAVAGSSQLTNHDVAAVTRLPGGTQTACKLGEVSGCVGLCAMNQLSFGQAS